MAADNILQEDEWTKLLQAIHLKRVIPVVGSKMVTIEDPDSKHPVTLQKHLAPKLAEQLGLGKEKLEGFTSFNEVARAYLVKGGEREIFYPLLSEMLANVTFPPSPALRTLAGIRDFNLFVASTPDPMLARAVEQMRPAFSLEADVLTYHPNGSGTALKKDQQPDSNKTYVFHILGNHKSCPDLGVADEDYIEYVCSLIEKRDTLGFPITDLRNRNLLLLGTLSDDWIVRFFLRAIRGERFSSRKEHFGHLVDRRAGLGEPMIFYFDNSVIATKIIDGSPQEFTAELAARWHSRYGITKDPDEFLRRQASSKARDSVFISYSRDDRDKTVQVGMALANAGVPVWLDIKRLDPGNDYDLAIESAVKDCSFFISLISRATEGDAHRYVHKERAWAAQGQPASFAYYLPLVLDDTESPKLEPERFSTIERKKFSELDAFVVKVRKLMDEFRVYGRPRS